MYTAGKWKLSKILTCVFSRSHSIHVYVKRAPSFDYTYHRRTYFVENVLQKLNGDPQQTYLISTKPIHVHITWTSRCHFFTNSRLFRPYVLVNSYCLWYSERLLKHALPEPLRAMPTAKKGSRLLYWCTVTAMYTVNKTSEGLVFWSEEITHIAA